MEWVSIYEGVSEWQNRNKNLMPDALVRRMEAEREDGVHTVEICLLINETIIRYCEGVQQGWERQHNETCEKMLKSLQGICLLCSSKW